MTTHAFREERSMNMQVGCSTKPLKAGFGVEILDVDIATASDRTLSEVVATFQHHGAIVLRNQRLTPEVQLAFTRLFGEPEENARKEYCDPDYPQVYVLSNKVVNGRPIGDSDAGYGWHTDNSYSKLPALCTILHAIEVPPEGSDTQLSDLCAAWDALPASRQQELDGLVIHHSYAALAEKRKFDLTDELRRNYPDVYHPLVRRHAADGRKALWVSTGTVRGVVGMANPRGVDLIDELVAFATQDRFIYSHKWAVGDVLVWDNRCTLHRATPYDKTKYSRLVHRTWVRGEAPA
jgi:taurine dioxygenase